MPYALVCSLYAGLEFGASDGYRLSRPVNAKITHSFHMDDFKIHAVTEERLERVMKEMRDAMKDIGLIWIRNERKRPVVFVKRGCLEDIASLKDDAQCKFLGLLENIKQQDCLVLEQAEKNVPETTLCSMVKSPVALVLQGHSNQTVCQCMPRYVYSSKDIPVVSI